jgi:phosphatidylglycerol:prolipoprotein diacylglycerol transferase
MLYAVMRFGFEFLRVPAQTVPFLFGWMTMGQVLCVLMFLAGLIFWLKAPQWSTQKLEK